MLAMEWERGVTAPTLAAEWDLSVTAVEKDSADASKLLEIYGQPEAVKQFCMAHLHRVIGESGRDRVRAIEVALKATGNLVDRVQVEVPTRTTPDMYAAALEHPGFVQYLREKGWRPPMPALLTEGSAVK